MSPPTTARHGRQAVEAVWRIDSARVVGALARYTGDFALAEDLAQEALAEALVAWPRDGVPHSPAGWLLTVGRRRAVDSFRRRTALDERYTALARGLEEGGAATGAPPSSGGGDDVLWDPDRIDDDLLALMFTTCHPVLSREASIALTLRILGGLSSGEIARAFLAPTATVQARITRAKKTLAAAQVPFAAPPPQQRRERLARQYGWPELPHGWCPTNQKPTACSRCLSSPPPGSPHGSATTASRCCLSIRTGDDGTVRRSGALPLVDELASAGSLAGSHLLPSVRGELLTRLGRADQARSELESAVGMCLNDRERGLLQGKLAALG